MEAVQRNLSFDVPYLTVKYLLERGVDTKIVNNEGQTALGLVEEKLQTVHSSTSNYVYLKKIRELLKATDG